MIQAKKFPIPCSTASESRVSLAEWIHDEGFCSLQITDTVTGLRHKNPS